jgi:hypothetical protein
MSFLKNTNYPILRNLSEAICRVSDKTEYYIIHNKEQKHESTSESPSARNLTATFLLISATEAVHQKKKNKQ